MRRDNMPHQCQTQSRTPNSLRQWIACAIELLKDPLMFANMRRFDRWCSGVF